MLHSFFKRKRRDAVPDFIKSYQVQDFSISASKRIEESVFVSLDCETTGMEKSDQIITIGAVKLENDAISLADILDIRLSLHSSGKEAEVHGELGGIMGSRDEQTMQMHVLDFLSNHIILGHNIDFDIIKINQWISSQYPGFKLKNKRVDTMQMIWRLDPRRFERRVAGNDSMQLDVLCDEYEIPVENRHTALGDAYMTAQLFHRLMDKLTKRGITQLKQIVG